MSTNEVVSILATSLNVKPRLWKISRSVIIFLARIFLNWLSGKPKLTICAKQEKRIMVHIGKPTSTFASFEEMEKNANSDMISYSNLVNGKLNGGGAMLKLVADYGKIYLRKNK